MSTTIFSQINITENDLHIPKAAADKDSVATILQLVFGIFASVAVIVIVIAGLQFVLSRGNPEKAGKARNAVIYAAVGLVVALSAFSLIGVVVGNT